MGIMESAAYMNMNSSTKMIFSELPVFKPNEYFWANHWNEGKEERWEAYARVIRTIICEISG